MSTFILSSSKECFYGEHEFSALEKNITFLKTKIPRNVKNISYMVILNSSAQLQIATDIKDQCYLPKVQHRQVSSGYS